MYFISIETSTTVCSAALLHDDKCVLGLVDYEGQNHARQLPLFVDQLLSKVKQDNTALDAIVLSQGPGSYTGLRIGTALAKGLCYGLHLPLIAVDTLQIIAHTAKQQMKAANALLCPMIDARRMEVYTALYTTQLQAINEVSAKIIDANSFAEELTNNEIYFCGNGANKCKTLINNPKAHFLDDINPLASEMGKQAVEAFEAKRFADVAYFDPFYLKEFQATIAKNKVL